MPGTRLETDSMGTIAVPADRLWGAQTQRSLEHFAIQPARFRMPVAVIHALGLLKGAAAEVNAALGELPNDVAALIRSAAEDVADGKLDDHFPLVVFQTGSGTQTNMNANEVIAARANELAGGKRGDKSPVHPNDHVNRSQSSNDVFPTAMHLAIVQDLHGQLYPAAAALLSTFKAKAVEFSSVVKTGRTHLQDATPITLGQEIGAWAAQLDLALDHLHQSEKALLSLAIGGTAVGTGLNAHPAFGARVAAELARKTGHGFHADGNKFALLASHDAVVNISAALRTLAGAAFKMANDVRLLVSGPRCGIAELIIPENEPGSSIMPGKINPTQCEALTQLCVHIFGNDAAVAFAGTQGHLQLNTFKPMMVHTVLESIALLADGLRSFDRHCAQGLGPNLPNIARLLAGNLMLVTALSPHIGYDAAARIAKLAQDRNLPLREAALATDLLTAEQYDRWVSAGSMTSNHANPLVQ